MRRSFDQGLQQGGVRAAERSPGLSAPPPPSSVAHRPDKLAAAGQAARRLTANYGLAYMVAKNMVALSSMVLLLGALRSSGPAKAATAALLRTLRVSAGAGVFAGQLAFAVTVHYSLFPFVVLAAARLGPKIKVQG